MGAHRTGRVIDSRVYPSGKARGAPLGTVVRLTAVLADDTGATVSLYTIHCQLTGRAIVRRGYDLLMTIAPPLRDPSTWIPDGSRVAFATVRTERLQKRSHEKASDPHAMSDRGTRGPHERAKREWSEGRAMDSGRHCTV
jgi:hypothetical protein